MDVYEIVRTIGSGSSGQVYMVRNKRENRNYAMKKIKTRDMNPKDLEQTENEVTVFSIHFFPLRSVCCRKSDTRILLLSKILSLTGNNT